MVNRHLRRQSGNIFFALFGAIALVGILGAGIMTFIKGPLTMSVNLTKTNAAENQMTIAAQVAVMASANGVGGGDCDSDNVIEPIEWRSYTTEPHPTGGGLIPLTLGVNPKDPWGTEFGYCVWNHGVTTTGAGCGANLLAGTNSQNYPVVALVSAGPDRAFTTTCRTFAAADVNTDGDVADATDLELISKAAVSDDDIIYTYSYADAISAAGGLWGLKSTDPDTAAISKNIEVTGNASSTGMGSFSGGVLLPDTSLITCDPSTAGVMARSTSGTGVELCDGTSWQQISGSGGGALTIELPDQTVNATCNPANIGLMRYNTAGTSSSMSVTTGGGGGGGYSTPAIVQTTAGSYCNSSCTTRSSTFSTTPTAGNTVFAIVTGVGNGTVCDIGANTTVTDNKGNTYTKAVSSSETNVWRSNVGIWYAPVATTSATFTITATNSAGGCSGWLTLQTVEASGLDAVSPFDKSASGLSNGVAALTPTTAATTQADELAIGAYDNSNTYGSMSISGGWSMLTGSGNGQVYNVYSVLSSVGAASNTWTANAGTYASGAIATFKAASSGGGGPATIETVTSSSYAQVCDGASWVNIGRNELNDLSDVITNDTGTATVSTASLYSMYLGDGAGKSTTTGAQYNTALGYQSLYALASGQNNTAMGYQSMKSTTTGSHNSAFGSKALYSNVIGDYNSAMGYNALYFNTGDYNTGFGYGALYSGKAKYGNTAIGYEAMYYADDTTTASAANNTAIGYQALKGGSSASSNTGAENTALGYQALVANTAGSGNTAAGYQALAAATSGNYNVGLGYQALYTHTGSFHEAVGIGYQAGYSNTAAGTVAIGAGAYYSGASAIGNVAAGYYAMYYANSSAAAPTTNNTAVGVYAMRGTTTAASNTGTDNTALGHNALYGIRNGNYNTAAGSQALYTMSRGSSNTAAGAYALYSANRSSYNTALGLDALRFTYSGTSTGSSEGYANTAVGYQALRMASAGAGTNTGNYNTAVGSGAMLSATTASESVAVGYQALNGNTTAGAGAGTGPIAIGYAAVGNTGAGFRSGLAIGVSAEYNSTTSGQVAIGNSALLNQTGSTTATNGSVAIGDSALKTLNGGGYEVAVGYNALFSTTNGKYNTAVGYRAGYAGTAITTGANDTFVGYQAQSNNNAYTNGTAIGNGAILTASNRIVLGNASIAGIYAQVTSITAISDRRHKKDITDTDLGLSFINTLHPVSYRFNNGDETLRYGLIAQEIEKALPDKTQKLVGKKENGLALVNHDDDKDQTYHVTYGELVSPLVKAVQELDKKIDAVMAKFDAFVTETKTKIATLMDDSKDLQQKREQQDKEIAELEVNIRGLQLSCVAAGGARHD